MKSLHFAIHLLLLISTPSLFAHAPKIQTVSDRKLDKNLRKRKRFDLVTYDQIMNLIHEIESGEAEKKYREKDIHRINRFLGWLVERGTLQSQENIAAIEQDIEDLLEGDSTQAFAFATWEDFALYQDDPIAITPIGLSKKWDKTKNFISKHKKWIIIGAIVVIVVATVVITVASAGTAAPVVASGAAGTIGALSTKQEEELHEHIDTFKHTLAEGDIFDPHTDMSFEETGQAIGTAFAYDTVNKMAPTEGLTKELGINYQPIYDNFSSNYTPPHSADTFPSLAHQFKGEKALELGYYKEATHELNKAIEFNPSNPINYLDRGTAHFHQGNYEEAVKDFQTYTDSTLPKQPFNTPEFAKGFAKGLPGGVYESGTGILVFLADGIRHPINSAQHVIDAFTQLSALAKSNEWETIGKALSPEVHQLVTEWDTLPSEKRGELAGYALGKHGSDILIPGGAAKLGSKAIKSSREVVAACKTLERAEQTLLLEAVASVGESSKIAEVVKLEKQVSEWLGEGTKMIKNKAGDPVFVSKDGLRKVRFDFKRP